jgi:hypothetical protein
MFLKNPTEPTQVRGAGSKPASLSLTELINMLSNEQHGIRYDDTLNYYEVTDGTIFVEKFNSLRCTRRKRRDEGLDRPFARMHLFFVLIRGDKWGATGSAFRAKCDAAQPPPRPSEPPCPANHSGFPPRPSYPLSDLFTATSSGLAAHRSSIADMPGESNPRRMRRPSDDSNLLLGLRGDVEHLFPPPRGGLGGSSFSDALCPPRPQPNGAWERDEDVSGAPPDSPAPVRPPPLSPPPSKHQNSVSPFRA